MNKLIYLIPLLLLALSACAVNNRELAGRINGTPIPYDSYIDSYRGHYNNFYTLNSRPPGIDETLRINQETWRDITIDVILKSYFKKYGIAASAEETLDTLRANPPKYIKTSPLFQTKGRFDTELYLQSLLYDTPENLAPVRRSYRDYLIPILKLKERLIDDQMLTARRKKVIAKVLNGSADVRLEVVSLNDFQPLVTPEEVQARYLANQDQYRLEPFYSLDYVELRVKPSAADVVYSQAVADTLWQDFVSGQPLAAAVARRQQYFPGIVLKNSGFIRNGDLDPKTYELLIGLEEGAYGAPVEDGEGVTIYQLEQRTKSLSSFNTVRVPFQVGPDSVSGSRAMAERAWRLANDIGLQEAAGELELEVFPTGRLKPGEAWFPDPEVVSGIFGQLTGKKRGFVCQPVYSAQSGLWILAGMGENQLASVKPLAEVEAGIRKGLLEERRQEMAEKTARQLLEGNGAQSDAVEKFMIKIMDIASEFRGLALNNVYYDAANRFLTKADRKYYRAGEYLLVPQVISFQRGKSDNVNARLIRTYYVNSLPADWFDTWLEARIRKARVTKFVK
jgi:hypothetical protein